jgi:hypothetical protein
MLAGRSFLRLARASRLVHLVGAGCLIAVWIFLADPACPEINRETYGRIQEGMTVRQVAGVVGAPSGNWHGWYWWHCEESKATSEEAWSGKATRNEGWLTPEGHLWVGFTADGHACKKSFKEGCARRRTWLEKVRLYLFRKLCNG